jgi:AbiV family abortive infection protein
MPQSKRWNQLTITQIENGIQKIIQNARELVEESELLFNHGRYARAYTLAHLACEELAKVPMLTTAAVALTTGQSFEWDDLNRHFSNHQAKIVLGFLVEDIFDWITGNQDPTITDQPSVGLKDLVRDNNRLKNDSLYVGITKDGFRKPSENGGSRLRMLKK